MQLHNAHVIQRFKTLFPFRLFFVSIVLFFVMGLVVGSSFYFTEYYECLISFNRAGGVPAN